MKFVENNLPKNSPKRLKPGVTLLEIIIVLTLLVSVSFVIYNLYRSQLRLFSTQIARIGVSSQNKLAIKEITTQTRQAENIINV